MAIGNTCPVRNKTKKVIELMWDGRPVIWDPGQTHVCERQVADLFLRKHPGLDIPSVEYTSPAEPAPAPDPVAESPEQAKERMAQREVELTKELEKLRADREAEDDAEDQAPTPTPKPKPAHTPSPEKPKVSRRVRRT